MKPKLSALALEDFRISVVLPVLVTVKLYVITSPAACTVPGDADFTMLIAGFCAAGRSRVLAAVTVGPDGGVPAALPVSDRWPASTSAVVRV